MSNPVSLLIACLAFAPAFAAEQRPTPRHDPAGQPFRRAPMAESARSVVVNLGTNLHAAFDTEFGRVHTLWKGGPLNLWGPPYSYSKSPFIADFKGQRVFSFPPVEMWHSDREVLQSQFRAIRTDGSLARMEFNLGPEQIKVIETVEGIADGDGWTARRTFTFPEGSSSALRCLLFAEGGAEVEEGTAWKIQGTNGTAYFSIEPAAFQMKVERPMVQYTNEIITEAGTEKGNPVMIHRRIETRVFVAAPKRAGNFSFSIVMSSGPAPMEIPRRDAEKLKVFSASEEQRRDSGDEHYRIEHFPLPDEAELMVTGMDWMNEKDLAVCTWLGEIYIVENAAGPVAEARYRRFARGLNEPLGLTVEKGEIFVVQKGELTRVSDTDRDGRADRFECVNDDWGYSGNYHSYSFGPLVTGRDEFMVFTTGQRGRSDLDYQGWAIRVDRAGVARPFCSGLRVPHGWGMFQGDIFVTDNQGNWIGACRLNHLQEGKFYGFQLSGPSKQRPRRAAEVEPPVLWFPRSLAPSTSGIEVITNDAFGPFQGQMLIGDFQNSIVMRASLEKVRGKWQGAVFPFAKGFLSGVNRLKMGADGRLYVGGGKRTWSTAAPKESSLERVSFTGVMPFEVQNARVTKDGFELRFTKPLEAEPARDPENYLVKQFTYKYHQEYGSPEFDHEGKAGATETPVQAVELSEDRKVARLTIPGLKTGYVTSFQLAVNSDEDEDLRNDFFYYTLNQRAE